MGYGLLEASGTYAATINPSTHPPPPPPAPFPGLYLPPQPSIGRLNCIFHIVIAPQILSGELATCSNSYIVAKAETLFESLESIYYSMLSKTSLHLSN